MTIIAGPILPVNSVSIEAETVEAQALTINATLNRITTTIAGVWDLDATEQKVPQTSDVVFVPHKNPSSESVMEGDDRTLVDPIHFGPGGKYRSILKLFVKYENLGDEKFAHGTGWLIRPDMLVTAGHNVFSWKSNAGRAREIKVFAGYQGASRANDPTVEFRRAKRVVTTSQWLSNRGSMAHDFAIVQLDRPFDNIIPFQYIETPPKDKLKLGVVGYPADKVDEQTGEKGGRMYELFEETEYNLTTQKDTMLQHYIDSNGGNSGGPVLRGSDLVAIATHVYGGDFNTASVLGRYGNPVQDYLAAFDLPQATPGRINLIPVGVEQISQCQAATGPQVKEITKLGDNIPTLRSSTGEAESWVFDSVKEIFDVANKLERLLGPGFSQSIHTTIPLIIAGSLTDGLSGKPGSFDHAVQQRAILADAVLSAAEARSHDAEGFFDDVLKTAATAVLATVSDLEGNIKFDQFLKVHGVSIERADTTLLKVAHHVTAELQDRSRAVLDFSTPKTEGLFEDSGLTDRSIHDQVAFLQELQQSIQAAQPQQQEEDFLDDAGDFFKNAANTVGSGLSQGVNAVGGFVAGVAQDTERGIGWAANNAAQGAQTGIGFLTHAVNNAANNVSDALVPVLGRNMFGIPVSIVAGTPNPIFRMANLVAGAAATSKVENTLGDEEGLFDSLRADIERIAQALVLRTVIADKYLDVQLARPMGELKEEGIFDSVTDFLARTGSVVLGGASRVLPGPSGVVVGKAGELLGSMGNQ